MLSPRSADSQPLLRSPSGAPAIPVKPQEPKPLTAFLDHERLMDCIHCGLCLSQCPTYAENGQEADSPRGRIYLMRALAEGRAEATPDLTKHLDLCLGCRACETACPSGVQYGHLLEGTRQYLRETVPRPAQETARNALIEAIFPHPARLEAALLPVRLGRRWGVIPLLRKIGAMKLLGRLGEMEAMLPPLPPMRRRLQFPERWKARGEKQARVGMITGCVMPVLQVEVNYATARLLSKAGCSVEAPKAQGCCGALHAHVGAMDEARELAKKNIVAFERLEAEAGSALDAIIINAAGCGSALKEYGGWFKGDPEWEARADRFAERVRDVSEWLAEPRFKARLQALLPTSPSTTHAPHPIPREVVPNVGGGSTLGAVNPAAAPSEENRLEALDDEAATAPPGAIRAAAPAPRRLTYHDACHLCHGQGVRAEPRELLAMLTDAEVVPLRESEMCCGSAGIYNLTQPAMADRLLQRKMEHIRATGARVVATGNPGCALQIRAGAGKFKLPVEVRHPAELLDKATGK